MIIAEWDRPQSKLIMTRSFCEGFGGHVFASKMALKLLKWGRLPSQMALEWVWEGF
jgi:hypothetical protein